MRIEPSRKGGTAIDWGAVRRGVEASAAATQRDSLLTPDQKREILRQRAKAVSREEHVVAPEAALHLVEFSLAHETYAFETAYVREVFPLQAFAPLPGAPAFVLGLASLRGQILSLLDLKQFFDLPSIGLSDLNKIIVLRDDQMEFGILADSVNAVRSVPLASLQPSLPTMSGVREEYLKGITAERLIVLNAPRILSDPRILVRQH